MLLDDMINESYKYIIKEVKKNNENLQYKYIVVDEYQDITFQRFLFVKRLVEYFGAKLIAVGDDWQSIYSFNGSRLELFNKFSEIFLNSNNDMYLNTTYRFGQELANISSEFILKNENQIKKEIKATKELNAPIEKKYFRNDKDSAFNEQKVINDIVNKIYNNNPNDKILLLARNNGPIEDLVKGKFFKKGINDIVICNQVPKANIEAITIHSSKGLTANQVIVFGLKEKLFPSKGKAKNWVYNYFKLDTIDEWIKKYKEEIDISVDRKEEDFIDNPEERRLFYVAITRTKNKVYLVVPEKAVDRTPYVDEVENIQDEYEKKY